MRPERDEALNLARIACLPVVEGSSAPDLTIEPTDIHC